MSEIIEKLGIDRETLDTWITRLRSGDYRQGNSVLCYREEEGAYCEYCCLGILADVVGPDDWEEAKITDIPSWGEEGHEFPHILHEHCEVTLSDLNDSYGYSFNKIADFILEYVDSEFDDMVEFAKSKKTRIVKPV